MSHSLTNLPDVFIFIRIINSNIFKPIIFEFTFNDYSLSRSEFTFSINIIIFHHSLILVTRIIKYFSIAIHFPILPYSFIFISFLINHKSFSFKFQIFNISLVKTSIRKIISLFRIFYCQFIPIDEFNRVIVK